MKTWKRTVLSISMALLTSAVRAHAAFEEIHLLDMYDAISQDYLNHPTAKKWNAFLAQARPGGAISVGTDPLIRTLELYDFVKGIPGPKRTVLLDDLVYETLMIPDIRATENYIVRPHLAQKVELDTGEKALRITLNPQARFSDGTPVVADDVVASWNIYKESIPRPVFTDAFVETVNVEKTADGKILVTFVSQEKDLIRRAAFLFLSALRVVKPNPGSSRTEGDQLKLKYIGTGPYTVARSDRYKVTLTKNPDYWAKGAPQVKGMFNFQTVNVVAFAEADTTRQGITSRLTDFHREINPTHLQELRDSAKRQGYKEKVQSINYIVADGSARALFMNTQSDGLRDVNLRKALAQAWDASTAEYLFNDLRVTPSSPGALSPQRPRGLPSARVREVLESTNDPLISEAVKPYEDMGYEQIAKVHGYRPRMEVATQLLRNSGYVLGYFQGQPTLMKNRKPIELKIISIKDRPDNRRVMLFTELLKKLGINVEFRMFPDLPQFQRALNQGNYDFAPASLALHRDFRQLNILYLRQSFHTDGITSNLNRSRLSSPAVDLALTKLKSLSAKSPDYPVYLDVFFRSISAHIPFILLGEPVESHIFIDQDLCVFPEVPSDEIPKNLLSIKTGYFGCRN